jgi:UDP-N-acetylmuramoyl-L-alanyl-D-glutamate--2,6-diaminopimelate ligase
MTTNSPARDAEITGLTADSREVRAGYLFAAFSGTKTDGRQFIEDAVKRGAVAVLTDAETMVEVPDSIVVIRDNNPRQAFAKMTGVFFGKQMDTIVAVTGTNGKSSTVNFCRQLWTVLGHPAACLGTLGMISPTIHRAGALTTPDPVALHSDIAELEAAGVTHLALEASSQGMHQYRLDGVRLTAAGFTNLTRDHLDYHGSMENYFAAKARLFSELVAEGGTAVLNADTPYSTALRRICDGRSLAVVDFGSTAADIRLLQRSALPDGQFIALEVFGAQYELEIPLVGDFQIENALCALGLVLAPYRKDKEIIGLAVNGLRQLQSVRGRLEFAAKHPNGAVIYVDYAHTPDGLETMLKALRPHTPNALQVVFGCGGDRDRGKRPMMGEIAARLADKVIVTDDNPRTEDAAVIRAEVMQGCPAATEIAGRRDAIRAAIHGLQPQDVLVIAGKGHEQGQIVGKEILPFDDVSEARLALEKEVSS